MPSREQKHGKVQALVFVGDAMEESIDDLCAAAGELGLLGVPAFMFQEGGDAVAERPSAKSRGSSRGAYCRFDPARRMNSPNCCGRPRPMRPAA